MLSYLSHMLVCACVCVCLCFCASMRQCCLVKSWCTSADKLSYSPACFFSDHASMRHSFLFVALLQLIGLFFCLFLRCSGSAPSFQLHFFLISFLWIEISNVELKRNKSNTFICLLSLVYFVLVYHAACFKPYFCATLDVFIFFPHLKFACARPHTHTHIKLNNKICVMFY